MKLNTDDAWLLLLKVSEKKKKSFIRESEQGRDKKRELSRDSFINGKCCVFEIVHGRNELRSFMKK